MRINKNIVNFIGFQCLWLVTVLSAAGGYPQLALLALVIWLSFHLTQLKEQRFGEIMLIGIAAIYGYLADSILVLSGMISFAPQAVLGWPSTLWMVVLWAGFATTIRHSMSWLSDHLSLAVLFGVIGGPLAYFAGMRLGALYIHGMNAFISVAVEWAISMLVLIGLNRYLDKTALRMVTDKTVSPC